MDATTIRTVMASTKCQNETLFIKTKSIQRAVAPIATHLCYLMLLFESDEITKLFTKLESAARVVAKTTKSMAAVTARVIAESHDHVMKMKMTPLLQSLMMSGQNVLLVTQKIIIQPEVKEYREELTDAIQNVHQEVLKIILLEDEARIRKTTAAAYWLLECLSQVGAATDVPLLLKTFQNYSKAMLSLHHLVLERVKELCDHRQQENLKVSMGTLRRCTSMIHTAMFTTIKHPSSEKAQNAKKYILDQVHCTVNDVIAVLNSNCEFLSNGSYGFYLEQRNRLLRILSGTGPVVLKDNFIILLRDLVFHCLAVARSSRIEIQSCLSTNCKVVLQLCSKLLQQTKGGMDQQNSKAHEQSLRVSTITQIYKLDDKMITATLYQVMDIFVLTSSPLDNLLNTVHFITDQSNLEYNLNPLQPLSKAFVAHAEKMTAVASFISALASDEKSLKNVENSKVCLVHLKDAVTTLLVDFGRETVQYQDVSQKLINIQQRWVEGTERLLNAFSSVIKLQNVMYFAAQEIKYDFKRCEEAHEKNDCHGFSEHLAFVLARMTQVIHFVKRLVEKSDDPIYRNGLLALVRQAENSAAEVTGFGADIFNINHQYDSFSLMTDKVSAAIKDTDVLCKGLDGLQHPHLLSSLRENARQPVTATSTHPLTECQRPNYQVNSEHLNLAHKKDKLAPKAKKELTVEEDMEPTVLQQDLLSLRNFGDTLSLKHEDNHDNTIIKMIKEMADKIYLMTQYLKRKGSIQSKDAFVTVAKELVFTCQPITQFVKVIAEYCLDKLCTMELYIISEQIDAITNQLIIITRVNAVTSKCKSSDEILVKNAQNLLQAVIKGVQAAETACIKGLRQPEPNSEAAKAASLCFCWKKNLLIHRAQKQWNPETDDLGLRKTSLYPAAPSLAPATSVLE